MALRKLNAPVAIPKGWEAQPRTLTKAWAVACRPSGAGRFGVLYLCRVPSRGWVVESVYGNETRWLTRPTKREALAEANLELRQIALVNDVSSLVRGLSSWGEPEIDMRLLVGIALVALSGRR